MIGSREVPVEAQYQIRSGRVSLLLAEYDRKAPLRIDPVISYVSRLGGALNDAGAAWLPTAGKFLRCRSTQSANFPLVHSFVSAVSTDETTGFIASSMPTER